MDVPVGRTGVRVPQGAALAARTRHQAGNALLEISVELDIFHDRSPRFEGPIQPRLH